MSSAALRVERAVSDETALEARLFATRRLSLDLARPLTPEDQTVQAMDDASPTKWHLAHTTWFFETFALTPFSPRYQLFNERFGFCFNSYYETQGPRHPRPMRGMLTRPSVAEVSAYRAHVDAALRELFSTGAAQEPALAAILELGLHHEQQHQELLLTDILALFAVNPLRPAYREPTEQPTSHDRAPSWVAFEGGIRGVGHEGGGFHWDNEEPRHDVLLHPFRLCARLVTNGEWLEFMRDGGYQQPILWLADGWAQVRREGWRAPLYFEECDGSWRQMSFEGLCELDLRAPVCHVSFYEADAFARWAGKRLPTEFEWEIAALGADTRANDLASRLLRPAPAPAGGGLQQMFGDVWEWTQSAYLPYPGYRAPAGAIGEYNGKFMSNQMVLRGGSCVTPAGHTRASYRNFFYPHQRWQFTGVRLAEQAE
ncbi:MAG TPA: ergothioneine biosynthesis protein EgtB [Beijerinckiaceae bacterium]|nr:ergothioneine biosynthesis protein EgtB [Beijerinckiaceae bacterium]HVB89767.1 ergothioneine biosynthesis protein EgtB [Beijerinckiaceae bacterium]